MVMPTDNPRPNDAKEAQVAHAPPAPQQMTRPWGSHAVGTATIPSVTKGAWLSLANKVQTGHHPDPFDMDIINGPCYYALP
jgi:hypothetical protein